ncbi:MAG: sporulation protein YunB [Clostridia bacterium]|nr:sporulation protein YunB [Clostridia bacterium]
MRLGIRTRKIGNIVFLILFCCAILVGTVSILKRLEPVYNTHISGLANNTVNRLLGETIEDVFKNEEFNVFSKINNSEDNKVSAIYTDTAKINRLKSNIILDFSEKIKNNKPEKVYVPLMSAYGLGTLSGIGPQIPFEIAPVSLLNSEFKETFIGAGINCVKYTLKLNISIDVRCSGFMYAQSEVINTDIIVLETIISGDIPNYYGTDVGLIGET